VACSKFCHARQRAQGVRLDRNQVAVIGAISRKGMIVAKVVGFWRLFKCGIIGSYHKVSKDYLPLYVNKFGWRFNNRKNPRCLPICFTLPASSRANLDALKLSE
jgi:hypothetical protein